MSEMNTQAIHTINGSNETICLQARGSKPHQKVQGRNITAASPFF